MKALSLLQSCFRWSTSFGCLFFLFFSFDLSAQQRCATVEYEQQLVLDKKLPAKRDFELWLHNKIARHSALRTQASTYHIPVVVHIVHNGEAVGVGGNISDDQVLSQIAVLNKDYNRLNTDADQTPSDFAGVAGSIAIEFVLARQTPAGGPTNGIVRVKGSKTTWSINDNTQLKAQSYWPSEDYLNIWVCRLSGYLGYAQFPISDLDGLEDYQQELAATDGAVFSYKDFGSSFEGYGTFAGLDTKYNRGRTATHEIGHFLGLRHIWGDIDNCAGTDYVDDTPAQRTETYDCPSHPLSPAGKWCNSKAPMFQNYMDYTDDACMNLFTQGQIDRMVTVLENSPRRKSLLTSHGLMPHDPVPNDVAITSILDLPVISCNASPTPTLRVTNLGTLPLTSFNLSYTVNDGTPIVRSFSGLDLANGEHLDINITGIALSRLKNELSFALTEPNGLDDESPFDNDRSQTTYWDDTRGSIPMQVTLENQDSLLWTSVNPVSQHVWEHVKTNSGKINLTNDNHAVYFNGFDDPLLSDQAWYVSPVLDFSQTAKTTLFFDWSYHRRPGFSDNVVVMASSDCGTTFTTVYTLPLNSSDGQTTEWKPAAAGDWTRQAVNLDAYAGQEQVRIAFLFTNGNGNNFYLDNLNFFVPQPFTLYPNPASDNFYIAFNFQEETSASIEVIDAMGKLMRQESLGDARNQNHAVPVDALRPGVYVVRVRTSTQVWSTRFVRSGQ
ncbi:T9SS type A sorting domain-containing protein [Fulvivirgaceae bacterium PWU5]|uniref:T9SS type A sorting domain-containing protein n=1 Tax=Dawidia cretensis TaxID=2782350 RepID=A0AAP2GX48_9BACT|nr:M43 family zinc metalloprotease [Dawidia cretensis]MBT1712122.1 T9SS type A sorting domain-containing protein [Dawidia cretensis]